MTSRTAAKRDQTVKKRVEQLFVWSISPSRRSFFRGKNKIAFRKETNRLPQRRNFFAARQFLRMQKGGEKQSFGRLFPSWMDSTRVQTPFVLLQAIPLAGLTREKSSGRTAFRGGRQNVAESGFRLSSCIPLDARGSRISVLFPSRARLRGSRRGCPDVLSKCHLRTYCCPQAFWRLRDRRRPAPPKQAREFPRPVFLPFPEPLEYMAVPTEDASFYPPQRTRSGSKRRLALHVVLHKEILAVENGIGELRDPVA